MRNMKVHDAKIPRMEDILSLPVQDPPRVEFSAAHLNWVRVEGGRQGGDNIALIPFARVDDFVKGESSNAECPASFRIESRRKRPEGSVKKPRIDGYLEYTLYWCSYGPEDYRDSDSSTVDNSNIKPASGKGSRPGRRHMMRGCLCHFTVKRLYTRPLLALIIYNQQNHVDRTGAPCHGVLDRAAVGTRAMYAPRISEELRQKVMSMLYVGISVDNILQHHLEEVQRHGGPQNRDDFLTRNDVRNMERLISNSSHELHVNDECSVKMWVQHHRKQVFFIQERSSSEPFILGIQTDWQLQQMLHYGRNGYIASHSACSLKKLKYWLCSLLVFDSSRNAVPVAWVISFSSSGDKMHQCMAILVERVKSMDPRWKPNVFIIDDPCYDASFIQEAFQCQVQFCLWHVRRSWYKSLLKRCCSFDVQREMFKHLGRVLHCSRSGTGTIEAIEEFMQIYVDQQEFMDHFRSHWMEKIDVLVNCTRMVPLASLEPSASIESYHLRLKLKILGNQDTNSLQRIDWLVHLLTTEFVSLYWIDQYKMETGHFENQGEGSASTNSWYLAMQIPDVDVVFEVENLFAKIFSRADRSVVYTMWNPGSEFAFCDCMWSRSGNLCKHVIKVAILSRNQQVARPLLVSQLYREALLNLLQKMPDDPLVLEHAFLHVTRLQQDIKSLEDLSNSGLLQPFTS